MKGNIDNKYGHCYYCVCDNNNCSMIYNLYVEKEYRKKGYARAFIEQSIDKIRKTGYMGDIGIVAEPEEDISKESLIRFYNKLGLKIVYR